MTAASVADRVLDNDERTLDVLYVSPERFQRSPQQGTRCRMSWRELALYLSRPTTADAKAAAGAWSPALYRDDVRRKSNVVHVSALVVDVDANGHVDRVADALHYYRTIVHSTFSSTPNAPRCRIVLALTDPIDVATYAQTHAVVRAHLREAGIIGDDGAKDASRLSFAPVVRAGYAFSYRAIEGVPLDARAVLTAQPVRSTATTRHLPPTGASAYAQAGLRRAAEAIRNASAGDRHASLSREAFALARLDLSDDEIAHALLPAFVASAGETRRHEGSRTIRDAIRAKRGGTP